MSDIQHEKWYVERTSLEGEDFQARILYNRGKVYHAGEERDQIMIVVGEPSKRKGQSNIHYKPYAKLISKAPELLKMVITACNDTGNLLLKEKMLQLIEETTNTDDL